MRAVPRCDKRTCCNPATAMLALRYTQRLGFGYWACELHQAEAFWAVTKAGLEQDQAFDVVWIDPTDVEDLKISRA